MDEQQQIAVSEYLLRVGRIFEPGDIVEIPLDAMAFAKYQHPWLTLEDFIEARCNYDPETNEWLVHYVTEQMLDVTMPPVYVDVFTDGFALVDGAHRVTAHFIAGRETIKAHLNKGVQAWTQEQ